MVFNLDQIQHSLTHHLWMFMCMRQDFVNAHILSMEMNAWKNVETISRTGNIVCRGCCDLCQPIWMHSFLSFTTIYSLRLISQLASISHLLEFHLLTVQQAFKSWCSFFVHLAIQVFSWLLLLLPLLQWRHHFIPCRTANTK